MLFVLHVQHIQRRIVQWSLRQWKRAVRVCEVFQVCQRWHVDDVRRTTRRRHATPHIQHRGRFREQDHRDLVALRQNRSQVRLDDGRPRHERRQYYLPFRKQQSRNCAIPVKGQDIFVRSIGGDGRPRYLSGSGGRKRHRRFPRHRLRRVPRRYCGFSFTGANLSIWHRPGERLPLPQRQVLRAHLRGFRRRLDRPCEVRGRRGRRDERAVHRARKDGEDIGGAAFGRNSDS